MHVLIELEELRELLSRVKRKLDLDPDTPGELSPEAEEELRDRVSRMLDILAGVDNTDDESIEQLAQDEELEELAMVIVHFVLSKVIVRDAVQWFTVMDNRGGLAICTKPGVIRCR